MNTPRWMIDAPRFLVVAALALGLILNYMRPDLMQPMQKSNTSKAASSP